MDIQKNCVTARKDANDVGIAMNRKHVTHQKNTVYTARVNTGQSTALVLSIVDK